MSSKMIRCRHLCPGLILIATVVVAAGCGGGNAVKPIANLVPCSGTITLDGEPLDHGTVGFAPADKGIGQPAVGTVKGGRFVMMTTVSAPGVVIGRYHVSVQSVEKLEEVSSDPSEMLKRATSLIPEKYNDVKTSKLEVEVKKDMKPTELKLESK